ncbi:MAG: SRPBCC domain-containing protein [Myxococcaceae bacterium]|nr:SRPBCC domain-containing protein [Myxococcaceae bacterium]
MSELRVEVRVARPPGEVFAAIEDPFRLRRWYGAPPGCHRVGAEGDDEPGEPFRLNLIDEKGAPFAQRGRIVSVTPGEGVVLEMAWEGRNFGTETTRAAITLRPVEGGTSVEVRQGPFPSREAQEAHRVYWEANLGRLARVASGEAVPCFEEFWEESQGFIEPLGVAAYAVLAGMREAGATPEVIAQVEDTLYAHLARVPRETAEILGAVLRRRLNGAS